MAVPALEERLVEGRIRAEWAASVGPDVARRARPGRLQQGVLEVLVDNAPWLAELRLRQDELVAALAARFPGRVRGLRLAPGRPPAEPEAPGGPAAARPARPAATRPSAAERAELEALAGQLRDPELSRALLRLLLTDRSSRPRAAPPAKGA